MTRLISAARQSKSITPSTSAISRKPISSAKRDVADRRVDERRLAEDGRVDVDAGQARLHGLERRFDVAGDVERVDVRELLDDEQQPVSVADDAVADERLMVLDDRGDVAERERGGIGTTIDRDLRQVLGRPDRQDVLDPEALLRRVDEAAGARASTPRGRSAARTTARSRRSRRRGRVSRRAGGAGPDRPAPGAAVRAGRRSRRWRRRARP